MAVRNNAKSKKFTGKMKKKLFVVFILVGLLLVALSCVMIKINRTKGKEYSQAVYDNFTYDSRTISARRGDITDRNGTILAYSTKVYNLIIDAKIILSDESYREPTVAALAECFPDIDIAELNAYLDENANASTKSSYKRFLQELTEEEISDFEAKMDEKNSKVKGVWFEAEYKRTYPFGTLACDTLGFASNANGGEIGIENYYNSYLSGTDGRTYGYIDDSSYKSQVIPAINGDTVVTTIDYGIQNIIENSIEEFNEKYGSLTTTVVVMNPNNGEILGCADYPTFDLNEPRDISSVYTDEELDAMSDEDRVAAYYSVWKNNAVSKIYEPGSVFKTFTISELVEENLVDPKETFECDGYGIYNSTKILCHGGDGHGLLTMAGALGQSCNDLLMQFSQILGVDTFNRYLKIFKFGQKTDIDLPSEEAGILVSEENEMDVDLATNSFGQNLDVNMMQMISAFASVINGGYYYKPHVVKEILDDTGETVEKYDAELVTKTVSNETSKVMQAYLRAVVDYGTGGYVHINGYSIGGKTGAAEKVPRDKKSYIVSFMGFAPAENPQVLCYCTIDSPDIADYDTSHAAQLLMGDIMYDLLPYLGISADDPEYDREVYLWDDDKEELYIAKPFTSPIIVTDVMAGPAGEVADSDSDNVPEETLSDEEIQAESEAAAAAAESKAAEEAAEAATETESQAEEQTEPQTEAAEPETEAQTE